jgi:hypothetical protein
VVIPAVVVVAATVAVLGMPALFVWKHYKVMYFADYRAGYASVVRDPNRTGAYDLALCDAAVQAAYPEKTAALAAGDTWPQEMQAFYAVCSQKRWGQPADPWAKHTYLTSGRD